MIESSVSSLEETCLLALVECLLIVLGDSVGWYDTGSDLLGSFRSGITGSGLEGRGGLLAIVSSLFLRVSASFFIFSLRLKYLKYYGKMLAFITT